MINSQKTLIAYLDILGYKEIIEKSTPEAAYNIGIAIFEDYRKLTDNLSPKKVETKTDLEKQCAAGIINSIKFNILSDTIIVYLDCEDAKVSNSYSKYFENADNDYSAIALFFHMVSTFVLLFIKHTGYLIRGGISLGKFYKNSFDVKLLNGDLIFSEAFVKSYLLEVSASYPRVVIDNELSEIWLSKVETSSFNKNIAQNVLKKDSDGAWCLDFYEIVRPFNAKIKQFWLGEIKKFIEHELLERVKQQNIIRKWHWMKEYHNSKVKQWTAEQDQNLNALIIK